MKILKTLCIFGLPLLVACKSGKEKVAERNAVVDSTVVVLEKNLVKTQLDSVFAKHKFNGAISVQQNGQNLYEREEGFQNFKEKTKLSSNSVFAIGSLSKQFTAVMVLLQEEQGKLSTKDLVSKYLVEFQPESFKNITVQQLLNHTSGLNDFGQTLLSKPGKEFHYSNKGYRYLGKLIEKGYGKGYGENATALFKHAGMAHSSTATQFHGAGFAGANVGNTAQNSAVDHMPERLANDDISLSAGGVLSTMNDLHRWNLALYTGKILKPGTLQKFLTKSTDRNHEVLGKVGYADGIMLNLNGPKAYFHTGYVKGSPSLLIYYPSTKTSVVVLSNIADEARGKDAFFQPHAEVKRTMDALEAAVEAARKEMLKPVKD